MKGCAHTSRDVGKDTCSGSPDVGVPSKLCSHTAGTATLHSFHQGTEQLDDDGDVITAKQLRYN